MSTDSAHVGHPFKDVFNIESYNRIWFDSQLLCKQTMVLDICGDKLPFPFEEHIKARFAIVARPDTIEGMEASLVDHPSITTKINSDQLTIDLFNKNASRAPF